MVKNFVILYVNIVRRRQMIHHLIICLRFDVFTVAAVILTHELSKLTSMRE